MRCHDKNKVEEKSLTIYVIKLWLNIFIFKANPKKLSIKNIYYIECDNKRCGKGRINPLHFGDTIVLYYKRRE